MNIAIIGSGPSAFYTVQSFLREPIESKIDIFEKLPAPFGLVRYGVAPDHQKTKNIIRLFSKYLDEDKVEYFGNVEVGKDISLDMLSKIYDVIILACGATEDKKLNIEGEINNNIFGSSEFVGWYNGHPLHSNLSPNFNIKNAVIIGNGNVALDCARILSKSEEELYDSDIMDYTLKSLSKSTIENIYILGRRTPKESKFTISELREMGNLKDFQPTVEYDINDLQNIINYNDIDARIKKNIEALIDFKKQDNKNKKKVVFKFLSSPYKVLSNEGITNLIIKKNKIINSKIMNSDKNEVLQADLIISAIGYKVKPIKGLDLDSSESFFLNDKGYIRDNIYTNGWASGASVGVIGTNKVGASLITKKILNEVSISKKDSRSKIKEYFYSNDIKYINKDDWKKIDKIETDTALENFTRKKLVDLDEIFDLLKN